MKECLWGAISALNQIALLASWTSCPDPDRLQEIIRSIASQEVARIEAE